NANLKSLVDSTLLVLTAGVQAKRLDVTTNLTTKPLYFVGVHRAVTSTSGSFSTWTVVGMDDPEKLTSLVGGSEFAQNATATPPASLGGTIGRRYGIRERTAPGGRQRRLGDRMAVDHGLGQLLLERAGRSVSELHCDRKHHLLAGDNACAVHGECA